VIRQAFKEESMRCLNGMLGSGQTGKKKVRHVKNKVKNMLHSLFDIKEIVHKKICPGRPNSLFCILL
jgi:hypothetical protein